MTIPRKHTRQEAARIAMLQERANKIASSPELCSLFDLADRICMQAMRRGGFDIKTARIEGPYAPWGAFISDLKKATDAVTEASLVVLPPVPAIPDDVDPDLRQAVTHFARLAGVSVPKNWT